MRIGIDNALGLASDALALRARRTDVLAANIAQADTPGYKARDFNFHQVLAEQTSLRTATKAGHGPMVTTHAAHRTPEAMDRGEVSLGYRIPLMPSLDGNTVDSQVEQGEFAQNTMEFLTNLRILNGRIKGMMNAIKGE